MTDSISKLIHSRRQLLIVICTLLFIVCSDGLVLFENLPYEAQNLDSAGPESLRQLDVEVHCQLQHCCQFHCEI